MNDSDLFHAPGGFIVPEAFSAIEDEYGILLDIQGHVSEVDSAPLTRRERLRVALEEARARTRWATREACDGIRDATLILFTGHAYDDDWEE